jgi:hypothetical protein
MESPPETKELSFDEQKKEARIYGILTATCALIAAFWFIPLKPLKIIAVIAMLGLAGNGWLFLFHGSTVISMLQQGKRRLLFQIFISILTPIPFSIYFLKDTQSITLEGINVFLFQEWTWSLFSIGFVGYFSWLVAKYLDKDHPFRGFVIASTVFFVICFFSQHGIRFGNDDDAYGYNGSNDIAVLNAELKEAQTDDTKEKKGLGTYYPFGTQEEYDRHKEEVGGGLYLFIYIRCVVISYAAMFLGICWNRRVIKKF